MFTADKALQLAGEILERGSNTIAILNDFNSFVTEIHCLDYVRCRDDHKRAAYEHYKGNYPKETKRHLRFWANLYLGYLTGLDEERKDCAEARRLLTIEAQELDMGYGL